MRRMLQLAGIVATALAACSIDTVNPTLAEDCAIAGDEDRNGMSDCGDPACADAAACQPMCGNGKVEAGEGCEDLNSLDGDGCDSNCMPTGCGNGIQSTGEQCDDGNATSGDGCDNNCTPTNCGNGVQTAGEQCDLG